MLLFHKDKKHFHQRRILMDRNEETSRPAKVRIADKLSPDRIIINLEGNDREEVIKELGGLLKDDPGMGDYDKFIEAVFKRENDESTGIGHGVAIPHARTNFVNDFVIAIGRKKDGIDFQAVDEKPAEIIILMGTPLTKISSYLKLLSHLINLLKRPGFVDALCNAPNPEGIVEVFRQYEK